MISTPVRKPPPTDTQLTKWQQWIDSYNENRQDYINRMVVQGYKIVIPEPNEIQIDIDSRYQERIFREQLEILHREFGDLEVIETESKGGPPGKHFRIFFVRELSALERIAYQAALGSDPMRELLSIFRLERGDTEPSLLVEHPFLK